MRPRAFHDLWNLAVELAPTTDFGTRFGPASTFDCSTVGLILRRDEGRLAYDSTPLNADSFAETGGDGVHFSVLSVNGCSPDASPIVMTVPMATECNFVVGADFVDFLSLGCRFGYFALEQLAYDRDQTIDCIQSGKHALAESAESDSLLAALRTRFNLRPWSDVGGRLTALHGMYMNRVQMLRN